MHVVNTSPTTDIFIRKAGAKNFIRKLPRQSCDDGVRMLPGGVKPHLAIIQVKAVFAGVPFCPPLVATPLMPSKVAVQAVAQPVAARPQYGGVTGFERIPFLLGEGVKK